jgi:hypothetical protein
VSIHPYIAAELSRQRHADLLSTADKSRLARALLRQRGRHPLKVRLAAGASPPRGLQPGVRHPVSRPADELTAS